MRARLFLFLVLSGLSAVIAGASAAQDTRAEEIASAREELAQTRRMLDAGALEETSAAGVQLRAIRDASRERLKRIERDLARVQGELDSLGKAPGENDPPESEFLAATRAELMQDFGRLTSERTQVLANIDEAGDLLTRLSAAGVGALYQSLFERGRSPLAPALWVEAGESLSATSERIGAYFGRWGESKRGENNYALALGIIAFAIAVSLFLFGPVSSWVTKTFSREIQRRKPSKARRVVAAGLKMVAWILPGVVGGLIIIETLRAQNIITEAGEPAAQIFWFGILAVLLVSGFANGLFAPANPEWRIAPIDEKRGRRITTLALFMVAAFSIKTLLVAIANATHAELALIQLVQAVGAILIGGALFLICRTQLWRIEGRPNTGFWRFARRLGRALAIVIVASALAGYVALADFVASRFCYLALFTGLAWLLRAALMEIALWTRLRLDDEDGRELEENESQNFKFWSQLLINVFLFIAILPAFLVLFGVPAAAVRDISAQALFGFNIGGVRIPSIANLFYAIIVFIGVMAVTKFIQRGLQRGPLAHSKIDIGVQQSLITLLGYAGLVIAIFASVSAVGFGLQNLALIAGALSVGIGFGLQSIVNNFVSGLILLFERPIKVGDWVVTASGEGMVKKISVRSTEIETFNRSSIIVPNSELVSSTVTNWTHKNKIGRIIVPIGVSYDADPVKVKDILLHCAREHPLIVNFPEPFIVWQDFGASSLDFELRAYLADISNGLTVRTDLRFAIFLALKEAGIEIPFPQRDVHVKSLPDEFSRAGEAALGDA